MRNRTVLGSGKVTLGVLAIAAIVLAIRKPDSLLNPQFWAEDGAVFFIEQYEQGFAALFKPYAGYLLLVPRLVALLAATFFPNAAIPAVYNYSSLVLTLLVVASVFSPRFAVCRKPFLALAIVLVPIYGNEIFLTITNIQWILAILLIVVLTKEKPDSKYGNVRLQIASDFIVIVLCGFTGPFIILLLPCFVWKWASDKSPDNARLLRLTIAVALIQVAFVLSDTERFQGGNLLLDLLTYIQVAGYRVFGLLLLGINAPSEMSYFFSVLYVFFVLSLLKLALLKHKSDVVCFLAIQFVILLSTFFRFSDEAALLMQAGNSSRYFYISHVMLTWSLIALLEKQENWKNRLLEIALILILISSFTSGFQNAALLDYDWESYSRLIGKQDIVIPINPQGWHIYLKTP